MAQDDSRRKRSPDFLRLKAYGTKMSGFPTIFARGIFGVGKTYRGTGTWVVGRKSERLKLCQHALENAPNGPNGAPN